MTISRTIWVILDIFVILWIGVVKYLMKVVNPRYINALVVLYRAGCGNLIAGKILQAILGKLLIDNLIIHRYKYIHKVRHAKHIGGHIMSISETIIVILDVLISVLLEVFEYIWQRIDPRYLRGVVVLDRTVFGDFNAGRAIWIMIHGLYQTVVENIIIHKDEYIQDIHYKEYI